MKNRVWYTALTSLLLTVSLLAQAQPDPAVESATLLSSPALWPRIAPEEYEAITFQVKNFSQATNDNRIKVIVSLSALGFDEAFNPAVHITRVSGSTIFNFTYNGTNTLTAELAGNFPTGDAGVTVYRINKLVVQQISPKPQILIGANINISTYGALNLTTANDNKSTYTYTSSRISGNVFNDANGNAVKDANENYITNVWANLVRNGQVDSSIHVDGSGYYLFNIINPNTDYKIILTNNLQAKGASLPAATLPTGYISTGVNQADVANTSNKTSTISLNTAALNFFNQNFSIERTPTAMPQIASYNELVENVRYVLSPNAPVAQNALSGTDPEQGDLATGSTFLITQLPENGKLFYNNVQITASDVATGTGTARIVNYNPDKLAFSLDNRSVFQTYFNYKVEDAAGAQSPAVPYTINAISLLPVTGLHLKAELVATVPHLTWSTFTEQGTSHFEIRKSYDAVNYSEVGTVKATGNSNAVKNYTYTDASITNGKTVYYKIVLVDINGKKTTSNITYLSLTGVAITLFPNPADNYAMIVGIPDGATVIIMDVHGRQIQQNKTVSNSLKIDLTGFASGTYLMQVKQNGEVISTKKFLKK